MEIERTNPQVVESKIRDLIKYIGDNPDREGLKETPKRVAKSYKELFSGYQQDPAEIMKTFKDGSCNEMVILKDIEFYSMCEHHMLPFFGKVSIAYIPNGKVLGVSKLARLVEIYARRLQIQEKFVSQIADALVEHLNPKGVLVIAEAKHLCMLMRGIKKHNSKMVTSAIRGVFEQHEPRQEALNLFRD